MRSTDQEPNGGGVEPTRSDIITPRASVFDRPGSLFPGIVRSKPGDFDQIMRANRRDMAVVLTLGVLALIAGAFCSGNKKK